MLRTYYGCRDYDLFEPHANIRCAVKMAKRLVDRCGGFLTGAKTGMAAYWQPLRATNNLNRRNREYILSHVRDACRSGKVTYHSTPRPAQIDELNALIDNPNTIDDLGLRPEELEPSPAR